VHAAKRHGADDLEHLTTITGTKIGRIGAIAEEYRPLALS
jgi:hypothetical protein